jgi:hypothetical protein
MVIKSFILSTDLVKEVAWKEIGEDIVGEEVLSLLASSLW